MGGGGCGVGWWGRGEERREAGIVETPKSKQRDLINDVVFLLFS